MERGSNVLLLKTNKFKGRLQPSFPVFLSASASNFGWERIGDIMEHSLPEDESFPVSPTKWVLMGHSMGTVAVEKVGNLCEAVVGVGVGDRGAGGCAGALN